MENRKGIAAIIIRQISKIKHFSMKSSMKTENMKHSEVLILKMLRSKEKQLGDCVKIKTTEISKNLYISPSTASPVIQSLVTKGMLRRTVSDEDRRANYIELTDDGRKFAKNVSAESVALIEKALQGFSDQELIEFTHFLDRMAQALLTIEPEGEKND